jgi:inositol-hexakisphosphate 5-kinase
MALCIRNSSSASAADHLPPTAHKARPRPSIPTNHLTNVLSMSNPLTASKISASETSTLPGVHHEYKSSVPAPQKGSKSITPEATASPDKKPDNPTPVNNVKRAATFGDNSPLLSERESIFATHYLPPDNNDPAPRSSAAEGAGDAANLPHHLNTVMEFGLPSSPLHSPISLRTLLSRRKSRSAQGVNNVEQPKLTDPPAPSTKRLEESRGTIHTVRRVASEGQPGKQILQLRVKDQHHLASADTQCSPVGRGRMKSVMSDGEEKSGPVPESNQVWRGHGSAMKEAFQQTGSMERSTSHGRTHVEKSIEATLPNREPAKNARTRKSSHLMGIFKETAPSDSKRRDGQPRNAQSRQDDGDGRMPPRETFEVPQLRSQSAFSKTSPSIVEEPSRLTTGAELTDRPPDGHLGDLHTYSERNVSVAPSDTLDSSFSSRVMTSKPEHDPYFRKRDKIDYCMGGQTTPVIPAKLLEDIRRHHNLTPTGYCGATLSHPLPLQADVDKLERLGRTKNVQVQDPGDHDEEDEEHISSAVYFPHPGPSDEDIEQFPSPDEEQDVEPFPALLSPAAPTPRSELKRTPSDLAPAEHIDISVRSMHEESVFHGDYQPSGKLREDSVERKSPVAIGKRSVENAPCVSDPEISSGGELSDLNQTEEGEVTPTPTLAPQIPLQRRRRTLTATAPKGAVMLEPYSHQVGGHSTMFRFSRRAVCKQLNNRENEFYERIERRHPDMLRFLPRLVTVFTFRRRAALKCTTRTFN